jgi:hypothetical protein
MNRRRVFQLEKDIRGPQGSGQSSGPTRTLQLYSPSNACQGLSVIGTVRPTGVWPRRACLEDRQYQPILSTTRTPQSVGLAAGSFNS